MALATATIIAGIGLGAQAFGQIKQRSALKRQESAQRDQTAASIRAENARERQAQLEATRRRRQIVRNLIKQRSFAAASVTSSKAGVGSSAFGGAIAQAGVEAGGQAVAVNQNAQVTEDVFSANRDIATAGGQINQARSDIKAGGQFINAGQTLIKNAPTIDKVGSSFTGLFA